MDHLLVFLGITLAFGWPVGLAMVITRHRQKMKELEYARTGSPGLREEVSMLRHEIAQLRETTTKFDMSYDAALDRLERRMMRLEENSTDQQVRASAYTEERAEVSARRY